MNMKKLKVYANKLIETDYDPHITGSAKQYNATVEAYLNTFPDFTGEIFFMEAPASSRLVWVLQHDCVIDFNNVVMTGNTFQINVKDGANVVIKNGTLNYGDSPYTAFYVQGGIVRLQNIKMTCGGRCISLVPESTRYLQKAKVTVDSNCELTTIGTEGVGIFMWGQKMTLFDDYTKLSAEWKEQARLDWDGFLDSLMPFAPTLIFDGKLLVRQPEGATESDGVYGICNNGSADYTPTKVVVNEHAYIDTKQVNGVGIHNVNAGTVILNGGEIHAHTGMTVRGGRIIIPEYSNLFVHAYGAYDSYIPAKSGQGLQGIMTSNAMFVENKTGYGKILGYFHQPYQMDIQMEAGEFISDHNYAIGSYSASSGSGSSIVYTSRAKGFVGSNVQLTSGISSEDMASIDLIDNTGNRYMPDDGIMKS